MTNLTNYHSHCLYCDGRANMDDFIRFAISEGFTSYGISSHAPLPFSTAWTMEWDRMEDYLSEFSRLKKKYAGKIELAIGLEIDYLNEENNPSLPCFQKLPLDYRIGSVHMLYSPEGKIVDDSCVSVEVFFFVFCFLFLETFSSLSCEWSGENNPAMALAVSG